MLEEMNKVIEHFLEEARGHGLSPDLEPGFLSWVGNEVWEGRAGANFLGLRKRACELVSRYKKYLSRESSER